MYRIDRGSNRISKLKTVGFSEMGFRERNHLQEWLANTPEALGEELLIIQKEFDGFNDTRERLDLLAIDKSGRLVVIENKLDDSGRDVVWQALKYASYCYTLSKTQITDIYQRYLDKVSPGTNAKNQICEFLGEEDFEEVVLNPGDDQRLILVAAQFRKEVTSTVLWLLKHKVSVKCFKATPFLDGDNLFLSIEQVIPLPEAEELMIGISAKEDEEQSTERGQAARHQLRLEFWQQALESFRVANVTLYANVGPSRDYWLNAGAGLSGVHYALIFNKDEARVELALSSKQLDQNKQMFDALYAQKDEINARFGGELVWRRMKEKKVSIIQFGAPFEGHNRANWPTMTTWLRDHIQKLEKAFAPCIPMLRDLSRRSGAVPSEQS